MFEVLHCSCEYIGLLCDSDLLGDLPIPKITFKNLSKAKISEILFWKLKTAEKLETL